MELCINKTEKAEKLQCKNKELSLLNLDFEQF